MKPLIEQISALSEKLIPTGGTTGQVLAKASGTDYDIEWTASTSGILVETDPIFTASDVFSVTTADILSWNTAYGWGDHSIVGYLTAETDPVFVASDVYGVTTTDIGNWDSAYTDSHTHTNKTVLDGIIDSGFGTQFLSDDGTYYTISNAVGGSDTEIQFNDGGVFGAEAAFTYDKATNTLGVYDILLGNILYFNGATSYINDVATDLTFTDANAGTVTLSTLVAGATNPWTISGSDIYFGTGTDKVGINQATPTAELEVVGHIVADDFDSNYVRYANSNLLLGPNAGNNELSTNKLYIDNTDTIYPLIYGEFDNKSLVFNAEVLLGYGVLDFNSANNQIYEDSGFLYIRDPNINTGIPVTFASFLDGSTNALVSDFIDLPAVEGITAALVSQWNTAYTNNHVHTDNILDWNNTSKTYQPFAAKQGTTLSFDTSADTPTGTTRLNLNGDLHTTTLNVAGKLTVGGLIDPTGLQLTPVAANPGDANTIWSNSGASNALYYGASAVSSGVIPTDDILDWSTDKYIPYATQQASLSFDTSTTNPTLTTRLNLNGNLFSTMFSAVRSGMTLQLDGSHATTYAAEIAGGLDLSTSASAKNPLLVRYNVNTSSTISNNLVQLTRDISGTGDVTANIINITDNPTTTGTISGSVLKATIGSTTRIDMNPRVADGASAIAYTLDTNNDLVTTGAKIISFKTGGAEYAYISRSSITSLGLVRAYSDANNYTYFNSEESIVKIANVTRTNFRPNATDGATAVAYLFDTSNTLSTSGSKLLSVQNNTVERFRVTPTTTNIGDIAGGNYTTIESDGTVKFNGNATYWRDELSDAVSLQQTGTGISRNATESTVDYTTASNLNDYMYTNIQLNHDKKSSSVIYPHIHWFQAENHIPNFLLRYRIQLLGGTKTTSWTDYPCNTNVYTYSSGTIHQVSNGAGITVNGSVSDIIQFKIYRDNADDVEYFGADPYTATVSVLAFDVHIECDTLGSRTEYSK